MKKIAFASVATLGLLGTAVVPAFGATSLTQSQAQISVAANVHCKVKHWAHRKGYRDAIRGDAFAGRRGHFGRDHDRDKFHKEVDFDRNRDERHHHHDDAVEEDGVADSGRHHGHHRHHKPVYDVEVDGRRHHDGRDHRDHILLKRDAGRIAQRWDERRVWGTVKWCRGKPVAGIAAGGGWHAKSKRK